MQQSPDLPPPGPDALAHSEALVALLADRIAQAGGWIGFGEYMELALYAPGLGYYSGGTNKFGADGDFVTAPELGSLFAEVVAHRVGEVLDRLSGGVVLEVGGGSGALAADLLAALSTRAPERYLMLETSADLRERQRRLLLERVPNLADRVEWLDRLPEHPVRGVILANEVLDALPVERFWIRQRQVWNLGVAMRSGRPVTEARAAAPALATAVERLQSRLGAPLPEGYAGEIGLGHASWVRTMLALVAAGAVFLFDYGGSRREIYHPDRSRGTLACHYRHRLLDDPFLWPGLVDITAWVDFSAVAEAAAEAQARLAGYGTQAHFLLAGDVLGRLEAGTPAVRAMRAAEARRLLLPGEMGERFKAIVFATEASLPAAPLFARDLSSML